MANAKTPFGGPPKHRASFRHIVSPLGADEKETPNYSPSREVTGSAPQGKGGVSQSQSAKDQRRGG